MEEMSVKKLTRCIRVKSNMLGTPEKPFKWEIFLQKGRMLPYDEHPSTLLDIF
jgi:hypothetical protein